MPHYCITLRRIKTNPIEVIPIHFEAIVPTSNPLTHLRDADDVGQAAGLGWANEAGHDPGLGEHVFGEELQTIQIELDPAPGVSGLQLGEVIGQLGGRQGRDLVVKVLANAAHGAGIGLDGIGAQALQLQVLQVAAIKASEGFGVTGRVDTAEKFRLGVFLVKVEGSHAPRSTHAALPYEITSSGISPRSGFVQPFARADLHRHGPPKRSGSCSASPGHAGGGRSAQTLRSLLMQSVLLASIRKAKNRLEYT